jgi:hypothetical protein
MPAARHHCLALLLAAVLPSIIPAQSVMQITTVPLRPGIWVLSGFANGNILVPDDGTDVLLVDAQSDDHRAGHGPPTDRAGMVAYRAMLLTIGQRVKEAVQRGESMETIVAARPAAPYEGAFGSQSRADQFVQLLVVGFPVSAW